MLFLLINNNCNPNYLGPYQDGDYCNHPMACGEHGTPDQSGIKQKLCEKAIVFGADPFIWGTSGPTLERSFITSMKLRAQQEVGKNPANTYHL